ncbi:putative transporter [Porphyridium purpureum]|uniref:Putative transporter n=1 Tax=Porphyridium purpureum TaxID=35688 RepID=A0A5J4YI68_PORPP|nr:putative transporter [Porphyridium purpureum]|eukprot:POR2690..scf270_19
MGNKASRLDADVEDAPQIIVEIDDAAPAGFGEHGDASRPSSARPSQSRPSLLGSVLAPEDPKETERRKLRNKVAEYHTGRRSIQQVLPDYVQGAGEYGGTDADNLIGATSRPSSASGHRYSSVSRPSTLRNRRSSGSVVPYSEDSIISGRKSVDTAMYRLKRREDREAEIAEVEAELEAELGKGVLDEEFGRRDYIMLAITFICCVGIAVAIFILGPGVHHDPDWKHTFGVSDAQPLYYPLDTHKSLSFVEFSGVAGAQEPVDESQNLTLSAQAGYCANNCADPEQDFVALDDVYEESKFEDFALLVEFKTSELASITNPEQQMPVVLVRTNSPTPIGVIIHSHQSQAIGRHQVVIAGLILIFLFILIMTDVVHRTLSAFMAMFIAIFFLVIFDKAPSLVDAWAHIDSGVIVLLFGMMIIVHVLSTTGIFEYMAVLSYQWSGGKSTRLFYILCTITAFLSAFLDNVTTVLLIAPVTINICTAMKIDPVPFLISEAIFSNIGGTATMIGDPPNIIIGTALSEYVGFVDFLVNLAPIVIVIFLVCIFFVRWWYRKEFAADADFLDVEEMKKEYRIRKKVLLAKCGIVFTSVIILFFTEPVHHVHAPWVALAGAVGLMLLSEPHDLHHTMESVEWDLLLFFIVLFITIESLAEMGLIAWIGDVIAGWIKSVDQSQQLTVAIVIFIWVSGIISGILDNIPYTLAMVPVVVQLSRDPELLLPINPLIWSLALGACLGGNMTLIGASANLVVVGIANRSGHAISFIRWLKVGPLVTLISLTLAMTYSLLRYSVGGDQN